MVDLFHATEYVAKLARAGYPQRDAVAERAAWEQVHYKPSSDVSDIDSRANAPVLVTGGTGSFGRAFVRTVLERHPGIQRLVIFSRDELKQFEMAQTFSPEQHPNSRYSIGDLRDYGRLRRAQAGPRGRIQPLRAHQDQ